MKRPYEAFDSGTVRRIATVLVVALVAVPMAVGGVGAQTQEAPEDGDAVTVKQGEECVTVAPITGNESAKALYDYRIPATMSEEIDPENPYYNEPGWSYSSEGTTDFQRANSSTFFLYEDEAGTLSLVFLHGSVEAPSAGGSLSVTLADLPEEGEWAVKDDEYENGHNYDRWSHEGEYDRIDWTWAENRTDGGVYEGLGEEFTVTVHSAFNENATLYDRYYEGTVEEWTVLSGDRTAPEAIELTPGEPVVVSDADCEALEDATVEDVTAGTVEDPEEATGDADPASEERILEYRAAADGGPIDVSFTVEGTVDYGDEAEPSSDVVEENDDGTVTVTSPDLDPGAVDSWVVNGRIVDFSVSGGELETVRIDGSETSVEELLETG